MKQKIKEKAYRVWVHSQIGEYPIFSVGDVDVVYAETASKAKYKADLWDGKNEDGEPYLWIDIHCLRAKEYDKIEYKGQIITRERYGRELATEKRNEMLRNLPENDHYYVQDARSYVGNSVLWWGTGGSGYTTKIIKAQKYTKDEIVKQFSNGRETDIIWSARHVEDIIDMYVDSQKLKREFSV